MVFHDGDVELAPGIEFLLVGGHARGQAVLRVHTARGWVILASDAVHVFEETDEERPFAIFYDLPGMLEGYRRINRLAGYARSHRPGPRRARDEGLSGRRAGPGGADPAARQAAEVVGLPSPLTSGRGRYGEDATCARWS